MAMFLAMLFLLSGQRPTVVLDWVPSDSPGVTQQCVYRSVVSGENYSQIHCFKGNNDTTYTDSSRQLMHGKTYYYVVQAAIGTDFSAPSNEASATIP